jgi:hypothetical protein
MSPMGRNWYFYDRAVFWTGDGPIATRDMNAHRVNAGVGNHPNSTRSPRYAALLWALTMLFALRVLGQAIQRWLPQPYLPPFGMFQGSGLQYAVLLSAQLTILGLMIRAAWRVGSGTLHPSPGQLKALTGFGALYMAGSVLRIIIGLAVPTASNWFKAWIPAFFHLVLAGFVITLALYARRCLPHYGKPLGGE